MSNLQVTLMPVRLFASIGYYVALAQQQRVVIDTAMPFDKRSKAVHRYDIVDTQGPCQLTVPINRPHSGSPTDRPRWTDATISRHGQWWRLHRTALESAYGRTPFFEYLIDRFDSVLCDRDHRIGIRVCDFIDKEEFAKRLKENLELKNQEIVKLYGKEPMDYESMLKEYEGYADRLRPYVCDTIALLHDEIKADRKILFEGAPATAWPASAITPGAKVYHPNPAS